MSVAGLRLDGARARPSDSAPELVSMRMKGNTDGGTQFQREPNASFIMGSGAAPQRRQATESVLRQTPQINNIGSFTKNINPKRKNEPQKKSNPKNEGIDKFNNIIGNTSTTRRKRKNGLW